MVQVDRCIGWTDETDARRMDSSIDRRRGWGEGKNHRMDEFIIISVTITCPNRRSVLAARNIDRLRKAFVNPNLLSHWGGRFYP